MGNPKFHNLTIVTWIFKNFDMIFSKLCEKNKPILAQIVEFLDYVHFEICSVFSNDPCVVSVAILDAMTKKEVNRHGHDIRYIDYIKGIHDQDQRIL